MSVSDIWYLENIDAQGVFCPKKIGSKTHGPKHVIYRKHDFIFKQKDNADKIYYITKGRIKIGTENHDYKSVTKAILGPGEIFGEKVLIGQSQRRDYAQALEETEVCIMSKDKMKTLFREHSQLYIFIMNLIGNRALAIEKRLESLVFKDSRSRIIEFLLEIRKNKGERVGYEWVVRKFLTHQEIANLTATSRQTVTTVLNDLKSHNILTFNRKRLLIRDLARLQQQLSIVS